MNCSTGFVLQFGTFVELSTLYNHVFLTLKKLSTFTKTLSYFFLSSYPILVYAKMSSVSLPRQYNSVLTWSSSDSYDSPGTGENNISTLANYLEYQRICCRDTKRSIVVGHHSTQNF